MLRLEKLQITGFKSFADHTELKFGEGITAVVGPNGCGKSNIADAITWVLGEQSAKNLRGAKMEDVIFNGTRDRKPHGMAEVLLTLVAIEDVPLRSEVDDIELPEASEIHEPPAHAALEHVEGGQPSAHEEPVEGAPEAEPAAVVAPKPHPAPRRAPRPRKTPGAGATALHAGERVTVGRRLYRSGESDYIMNGRPCRLRDIQDLFAGTGLGGASYAIIEQGRIGQILTAKPQDRRGLIEEAAGITKFKSRKRAAELRLESARQNLTRLNDIVSEVERQINSLKRQAAKARRYRRLREEMRGLLREIFAKDWEHLQASLDRCVRQAEKAGADQLGLAGELAVKESEAKTALQHAREAEEELARVRDEVAALELEADRARNRHLFQREQLASLMLRREELERDRVAIAQRLELIAGERERKAEELATLSKETDSEAHQLAEREAAYQSQLHAVRERERELEGLRQKLMAEVSRSERLKNAAGQIDDAERRFGLDGQRLEREAQQAATRRTEAEAELTRLAGEMEMSKQRLDALRQEIVQRVEALAEARQRVSEAEARLKQLQEVRSSKGHRLASLEELDARHAYYSDAVQHVLRLEGNSFNALGTLADYAEVDSRYERALESLFGRELQSILVPGLDDALAGVEYLVSTTAGRAAFLVVGVGGAEDGGSLTAEEESHPAEIVPDAQVPALGLLRLPEHIERAVATAYPEKAAALVVASVSEALERSRDDEERRESRLYVTVDGEQVVNGRVVVGGSAAAQSANLLGIKREIKELRAELEHVVYGVSEAEAEVHEAQAHVGEIEAESGQLDSALRNDEKTAVAHDVRFKQLQNDFERAEQHIRVVDAEKRRLAEELRELGERKARLAMELEAAVAERARVEGELSAAQQALGERRSQVEEVGRELAEARAHAAARQERRRAVANESRRLADEEAHLAQRRDRNGLEAVEIGAKIEQLAASLEETEGQSEEFTTKRESLEGKLADATAALAEARRRADAFEEELHWLRERIDAARERCSAVEIERARLLSDIEHLQRACLAELSQPIEEVVEAVRAARDAPQAEAPLEESEDADADGEPMAADDEPELPSDPAEAARARLEQIRRKLDQMGGVNMMAVEELEEAETRYEFMTTQRKDVLDSIDATERALAEIKRRSRQRFREAFTVINQNFSEMFRELFGGGRGEMILLDEEDVLESGVDIIAQPPGKRLQSVQLLSGGEKAMTAIALVLGIFKYRPSPFCILDEVDAPLDEMNIGRFSDHVIQMSETTQFLVITHSKKTMEAARALYGVTMEDPGVSKLVSVKFGD